MTAADFKKLDVFFGILKQNPDRLPWLDPVKGLSFTADPAKKAAVTDIAAHVLTKLDTVELTEVPTENFVSKLRPKAMEYFISSSKDKKLENLLSCSFFKAAMRIKQLRKGQQLPFVERLANYAVAFAEVEFDPTNRFLAFDAERGPFVTKEKHLEADAEKIADYVHLLLQNFTSADVRLSSHNGIYELQKSAKPYFESRLPKTSVKLYELSYYLLRMAEESWIFFRSRAKIGDYEFNEEHARLLESAPEVPQKEDFKQLTFGRDILFFLQKTHYFTRRYATLQLAIAERVHFHCSQQVAVLFDNGFFSYRADGLEAREQGLHKSVMIGCKAMAKAGASDSRVDSCLRELWEYQKDVSHNQELYSRLISFLEINEFHFLSLQQDKEWRPLEFSGEAIAIDMKKRFHYYSYAPRKELEFLIYAHKGFKKYLSKLASCDLKDRVESVATFSRNYLHRLDALAIDPRADLYCKIETAISRLFQKLRNKHHYAERFQTFAIMRFLTTSFSPGDEDFEEYNWPNHDYAEYRSTIDAIGRLKEGVCLALPEALEKAKVKKLSAADKGFGVDIPVRRSIAPKKKRPKPPTPASSPSPPQVTHISKISRRASPVTVLAPAPQPPPQKIEAVVQKMAQLTIETPVIVSTGLKYAPRVADWFQKKSTEWVDVEHNVARIMDSFYEKAVFGLPRQEYDYNERKQLIIAITLRGKTRVGPIIWAKGKDSLIYHRWFAKEKEGKSEHFDKEYVKTSYKLLNENPLPAPSQAKPKETALDGSYIESQNGRIVVISDPKNRARVRVILPK